MKIRKRILVLAIPLAVGLTTLPVQHASAVPITVIMEAIKAAVKKVIQAMDLKIQRLQNRTIWLQNAQKVLENRLSELKLREISEWSENQRRQYDELFEELWKVKSIISRYQRVRDIAAMQRLLFREYEQAWSRINSAAVFRSDEKQVIGKVYQRLLNESLENLNHLTGIMTSFNTQMDDAERLASIHLAEERIRKNLEELRALNAQNFKIMHARDLHPLNTIKQNYGLD